MPLSVSAASASSVNGLCAGVWPVVSVTGLVGVALSRLSSFASSMLAETTVSTWESLAEGPRASFCESACSSSVLPIVIGETGEPGC